MQANIILSAAISSKILFYEKEREGERERERERERETH